MGSLTPISSTPPLVSSSSFIVNARCLRALATPDCDSAFSAFYQAKGREPPPDVLRERLKELVIRARRGFASPWFTTYFDALCASLDTSESGAPLTTAERCLYVLLATAPEFGSLPPVLPALPVGDSGSGLKSSSGNVTGWGGGSSGVPIQILSKMTTKGELRGADPAIEWDTELDEVVQKNAIAKDPEKIAVSWESPIDPVVTAIVLADVRIAETCGLTVGFERLPFLQKNGLSPAETARALSIPPLPPNNSLLPFTPAMRCAIAAWAGTASRGKQGTSFQAAKQMLAIQGKTASKRQRRSRLDSSADGTAATLASEIGGASGTPLKASFFDWPRGTVSFATLQSLHLAMLCAIVGSPDRFGLLRLVPTQSGLQKEDLPGAEPRLLHQLCLSPNMLRRDPNSEPRAPNGNCGRSPVPLSRVQTAPYLIQSSGHLRRAVCGLLLAACELGNIRLELQAVVDRFNEAVFHPGLSGLPAISLAAMRGLQRVLSSLDASILFGHRGHSRSGNAEVGSESQLLPREVSLQSLLQLSVQLENFGAVLKFMHSIFFSPVALTCIVPPKPESGQVDKKTHPGPRKHASQKYVIDTNLCSNHEEWAEQQASTPSRNSPHIAKFLSLLYKQLWSLRRRGEVFSDCNERSEAAEFDPSIVPVPLLSLSSTSGSAPAAVAVAARELFSTTCAPFIVSCDLWLNHSELPPSRAPGAFGNDSFFIVEFDDENGEERQAELNDNRQRRKGRLRRFETQRRFCLAEDFEQRLPCFLTPSTAVDIYIAGVARRLLRFSVDELLKLASGAPGVVGLPSASAVAIARNAYPKIALWKKVLDSVPGVPVAPSIGSGEGHWANFVEELSFYICSGWDKDIPPLATAGSGTVMQIAGKEAQTFVERGSPSPNERVTHREGGDAKESGKTIEVYSLDDYDYRAFQRSQLERLEEMKQQFYTTDNALINAPRAVSDKPFLALTGPITDDDCVDFNGISGKRVRGWAEDKVTLDGGELAPLLQGAGVTDITGSSGGKNSTLCVTRLLQGMEPLDATSFSSSASVARQFYSFWVARMLLAPGIGPLWITLHSLVSVCLLASPKVAQSVLRAWKDADGPGSSFITSKAFDALRGEFTNAWAMQPAACRLPLDLVLEAVDSDDGSDARSINSMESGISPSSNASACELMPSGRTPFDLLSRVLVVFSPTLQLPVLERDYLCHVFPINDLISQLGDVFVSLLFWDSVRSLITRLWTLTGRFGSLAIGSSRALLHHVIAMQPQEREAAKAASSFALLTRCILSHFHDSLWYAIAAKVQEFKERMESGYYVAFDDISRALNEFTRTLQVSSLLDPSFARARGETRRLVKLVEDVADALTAHKNTVDAENMLESATARSERVSARGSELTSADVWRTIRASRAQRLTTFIKEKTDEFRSGTKQLLVHLEGGMLMCEEKKQTRWMAGLIRSISYDMQSMTFA